MKTKFKVEIEKDDKEILENGDVYVKIFGKDTSYCDFTGWTSKQEALELKTIIETHDVLVKTLKNCREMTDELSRTMDEDHWYFNDLKNLKQKIDETLNKGTK